MPKSVTCDWEDLDIGFEELIGDIEPKVKEQVSKQVAKTGRKGAKRLREEAGQRWGEGETGKRYVAGFTSRTDRTGDIFKSEIGNKSVPGLVHLLEKGHMTLGGRRVPGNKHLEPVFLEISPEFYEEVSKIVGDVLEG